MNYLHEVVQDFSRIPGGSNFGRRQHPGSTRKSLLLGCPLDGEAYAPMAASVASAVFQHSRADAAADFDAGVNGALLWRRASAPSARDGPPSIGLIVVGL